MSHDPDHYSALCNMGDLPKVVWNAHLPHSRFYTSVNIAGIPMFIFVMIS